LAPATVPGLLVFNEEEGLWNFVSPIHRPVTHAQLTLAETGIDRSVARDCRRDAHLQISVQTT
jgi:hypothetical protein